MTYDARLERITHGNGTQTLYQYDAAGRLTMIRHEKVTGETIQQLIYAWTADGLVASIRETDETEQEVAAVVSFTYDNRNRLIEEERVGAGASPVDYHLAYTYDLAGNRTVKQDLLAGVKTDYFYDVSDPSGGNRRAKRAHPVN